MNNNNYGFVFNDIKIIDDKFIKTYKNQYGKTKINNEIMFYKFINKNKINVSVPLLLSYDDGELIIKYIKKSRVLTGIVNKTNYNYYYKKIDEQLKIIHEHKLEINDDIITRDVTEETYNKVINRFSSYEWFKNDIYNSIHFVNGIKIKDIHYYCNRIKNKLLSYLNDRNYYNLIHGDIHLGNILLDDSDKIYLIDPRGYFGNTQLFGLYEYDYAKLLFGISGYSYFDNLSIDKLTIINDNLNIEFIKNYEYILNSDLFDNITKLFCLSIWLANNSCFIDINKKITSLMIGYYYCEKYIDLF